MIAIIVEATFVTVIPSRSIKRMTAPASNVGTMTCLPPTRVIEYIANASTRWNIGATCAQTSSPWSFISAHAAIACEPTISCVNMTPTGSGGGRERGMRGGDGANAIQLLRAGKCERTKRNETAIEVALRTFRITSRAAGVIHVRVLPRGLPFVVVGDHGYGKTLLPRPAAARPRPLPERRAGERAPVGRGGGALARR